jgi:DNA-binding response OmpR family regulator
MKRFAMVVEDDPELQEEMLAHLRRLDFDTCGALHYDEAIERLASCSPHIVCVDIGLPTRSGYDLCEYIRGQLAFDQVPILVTSDSGLPEDMANAEEAGANAFLKKPFSMRQLTDYVEALLGQVEKRKPRRLER